MLEFRKGGTPIRSNDMLITAQALSLDLILVTVNKRKFSRVPKLKVENWFNVGLQYENKIL